MPECLNAKEKEEEGIEMKLERGEIKTMKHLNETEEDIEMREEKDIEKKGKIRLR